LAIEDCLGSFEGIVEFEEGKGFSQIAADKGADLRRFLIEEWLEVL
jgi:hypothetical protein